MVKFNSNWRQRFTSGVPKINWNSTDVGRSSHLQHYILLLCAHGVTQSEYNALTAFVRWVCNEIFCKIISLCNLFVMAVLKMKCCFYSAKTLHKNVWYKLTRIMLWRKLTFGDEKNYREIHASGHFLQISKKIDSENHVYLQISSKSTQIWFPKLLQWLLSLRYISCCNSFLSRKLISLLPKTTDITTNIIYCDLTVCDCVNSKQVIPSNIAGGMFIAEAPPTAALFQLL